MYLPTLHSGKVASALFERRRSRQSDAGCELRPCLLVPTQQGAGSPATFTVSQCPPSPLCEPFSCYHPAGPTPVLSRVNQGLIFVSGTLPREFKTIWELELILLLLWEWGWLCSGVGCACLYPHNALHVTRQFLPSTPWWGGLSWYRACQMYTKPWIPS